MTQVFVGTCHEKIKKIDGFTWGVRAKTNQH
jgi:hypothetical protein